MIFVDNVKDTNALIPFWKRLKRSGTRIEVVANRYSSSIHQGGQSNIPKATLVFDHFHITKLFNENLTKLCRALQREARDEFFKLKIMALHESNYALMVEFIVHIYRKNLKTSERAEVDDPICYLYSYSPDISSSSRILVKYPG